MESEYKSDKVKTWELPKGLKQIKELKFKLPCYLIYIYKLVILRP